MGGLRRERRKAHLELLIQQTAQVGVAGEAPPKGVKKSPSFWEGDGRMKGSRLGGRRGTLHQLSLAVDFGLPTTGVEDYPRRLVGTAAAGGGRDKEEVTPQKEQISPLEHTR